jgi:hypothetical protein
MAPEGPYPAEFGFGFLNNPVFLYASLVHTGEGYRVRVTAPDIPRLDVEGTTLRLFGDPVTADGGSTPFAFFTNPTDCTASPQALTATIHADSWQNQASVPLKPDGSSDFSKANFADPAWATATQTLPQPTDCDQLSFNPTFALTPDTTQADSPTGPSVDLKVPQVPPDPTVLATPPLRDATVALPASLSANPSLADGLQGCTEAQIALDTTDPASCPDASKIGTAEVTTPLLPDPVQGQVFLGAPDCSPCTNADAQSGRLLKLYIQADQPETGVVVKLPGTVSADPSTGQLTAAFKNNPQLPFSDLKLQFKTGSRAPLRTPPTCGTYTTTTDLKPWSAPQTPDATPSSSFDVTSGPGGSSCSQTSDQRPLSPSFSAGTLSPVAGAFSPFIMKLTREDGQQEFSSLNVSTPPGIAADLRGVPYCPEAALAAAKRQSGAAEQANPSCPAASQIGTTTVGAGAGPDPYYVPGKVYLAGPYKGAPLSLAIVTPALAGPFDLGTVVVRAATYVDPTDAHLRVVSDPLPKILAGIPLDIRDVRVNIDKPHFTNNPTDCEPMSLFADVFGSQGAATRLTNRFQVGDCGALTFKPKLALSLKGGTARASHPALKATLTMKPGEANIAAAQVTLPHSEFLDQSHIGTVCTRVQFAAGAGNGANCPPASVYGHARAITPLLDKPLEGPVYLRSSTHKLPDLIVALGGQISVDLAGRVDTGKGGGIRNSFEVVPDAPVSKFTLTMKGGAKGLLVNSENICAKPHRAIADFSGQNGKVDDFRPVLQPLGCKHGKGKGGKRHKRAARTR